METLAILITAFFILSLLLLIASLGVQALDTLLDGFSANPLHAETMKRSRKLEAVVSALATGSLISLMLTLVPVLLIACMK